MDRRRAYTVGGAMSVVIIVVALVVGVGLPAAGGSTDAAGGPISFQRAPDDAGLNYTGPDYKTEYGRAGVFAADYNNDGWTDLLAVGSKSGPALFQNTGGQFQRSGALPAFEGTVRVVHWIDYNVDGWTDLVVLREGMTPVVLENRQGSFARVDAGLDEQMTFPLGATSGDYNGDGCPDLFVIQAGDWRDKVPTGWNRIGNIRNDNGEPNVLFEGTCDGFTNATSALGTDTARWSLATSMIDLTGDGLPDIHVANDYNNDTLWVNQGDGTFRFVPLAAETDRNGMASEVGDYNSDGLADVFITNIYLPVENSTVEDEDQLRLIRNFLQSRLGKRASGNTLLISQGNGSFAYRAKEYGVRQGGWGWAAAASDFNDDGNRDLIHATEIFFTVFPEHPVYTPPQVFRGLDNGTFTKLNATAVGFPEVDGRGVAELDYDRDGDRDLAIAQYGGDFAVFENTASGGAWLNVRVQRPDGTALGARVAVTVDGETQYRFRNARADFLSQDSRLIHVGLGGAEQVDEVTVTWPDGTTTTYTDVPVNRTVTVTPQRIEVPEAPPPGVEQS